MNKPVTVFKTVSGLDYIGRLVGETDRGYEVEAMLALTPQQDEQGQVKIGMGAAVHPAMGKSDTKAAGAIDVLLNRAVVLFPYEPTEQLENAYTQSVTGIQIASSIPKSRM